MAEALLDDLSPAYRAIQDRTDASRWQASLAAGRRVTAPQTPEEIAQVATSLADEYHVDPRLVLSIMGVESGGQAGVISRKGAVGLMQLMPATAQRFGVRDALDPVQNLEGGVRYLAWLRDQFPGRTDLQLAAYHAGEGAVRHAGYRIPDTSDGQLTTAQYVQTVLGRYQPTLPGEAGTPGVDLRESLTRQALRTNQPGPELMLPRPLSPYAQGQPAGSALPGHPVLPGEGGTAGLTLEREAARYPMELQTPLTVETSPEALAARTAGQPTAGAQRPWSPERWQEPGLEESLGGQLLGDIGVGLLQSWEALLQGIVALETRAGLNQPVPGLPDPMGLQLLIPSLQQAVQEVKPVRGSRTPNFLDTLATGLGTSLTGVMLGMGSQTFFAQVGKVAPLVANLAGATASGVTEALQEAGGVYEQLVPLVGQNEAAKRAMHTFAWNTVLVTLSDKLSTYSEIPRVITRTLLGVVSNGLQEAVQYELERHHLWVPATHPAAEDLVSQWGWQQEGERVVKPFVASNLAEATLVGMILGGATAAAIGGPLPAWQQVVEQERQAAGGTLDPQFSISTALEAAQFPDQPRAGVEPGVWQRWGSYLKDFVTPPEGFRGGMIRQTLGSQRGAVGGERPAPRATPVAGMPASPEVTTEQEALPLPAPPSPPGATPAVESLAPPVPELPPAPGTVPQVPPLSPGAPRGPLSGPVTPLTPAPTIERLAEGLPRYRTESGQLVRPLSELPSQELELQDFIRQQGGIRVQGEELSSELAAVVSRKETGTTGLQNNVSGRSLQQMAETAQEQGFIPTPDKTSLLEALDRSVTRGLPVYSTQAIGTIPLLDDPQVQASYQAVLDATRAMQTRTEEQVAGVRHRPAVHEEARDLIDSGQFTPDDIREIYPNTTLNDTMASALVQSLNTLGEQMAVAAQQYLDGGARIGSREEARLQEMMALFAELDPTRLGVSAAQARGLGILNDPLSGYTQFLNALHQTIAKAPATTMQQIARRILAARPEVALSKETLQAHPEILADLFAQHYAMVERFQQAPVPFQLEPEQGDLLPGVQPSAEDSAFVQAAYTPTGPARTPAEWDQVFRAQAQAKVLAAWQAGAFERARAQEALLPDLLALDAQRTAERARAMADWSADDRARDAAYAQAREVWAQQALERARAQWREGIRDVRAVQALLREGYAGRQLDLPPRTGLPHRRAEQQLLFPVDWDAVRAALDRLNALEPLDPLRNQIQQDLFSQLVGLQWDQAGADRLARYLAEHSTEDTLRTIAQALRPWEGQSAQLALFQSLAQTTQPGFSDYFLELWYNAMLSNPATHLANIAGNTVSTLWAIPERFVASYYGRGGPGQVAHGEASAMLYGLVHGIQDAWAGAVRSWQQGTPVSGLGKESTRAPAWTAEHLGLEPGSPLARFTDFFFNYIGLASGGRLPSKALMSVDEFFKMLNYRMELNALAYREATAQGYEGSAWREHVATVVASPTLPQLQQATKEFSVLQAFQQPLGQTGFWGRMQGIAEAQWRIPWTEQQLPVGRMLLPFVQTPANLARWNLERLPVLGQLLTSYQADVAAGGARAELARAKITTGALALLGAAGLFLSGRLTGRGPEDPDLRARWLEAHPEYSVRLPNGTWLSLARFEPAGTLLGMTADFLQLMGEGQIPLMERIPIALFMTISRGILSKTYFQSLSTFFDAVSPRPYVRPEEAGRGAVRYFWRWAGSMAQPSSFLAATARVLDPAEKEMRNLLDAIYARVPGWRDDVPSRRTLNGEKQLYGYGFDPSTLRLLARAYLPWQISDGTLSAVDQELLTQHISVPPIPWSLGGDALPEGMTIDDVDPVTASRMSALRLTPQQHERYAVLAAGNQAEARTLGLEIPRNGLTELAQGLASAGNFAKSPPRQALSIGEYLDWMIQQPEYLDPNRMTDGPEGSKAKAILTAIKRYRDYGFALLLAQDDALRERYGTARLEKQLAVVPGAARPGIRRQVQEQQRDLGTRMREQLGLPVGGAR
jgi:hypothetical protein